MRAGDPGLCRSRGRCLLPVQRAVHGLAHLIEPPRGALQPALAAGGRAEPTVVRKTEFHLSVCHIVYLSFWIEYDRGGVTKTVPRHYNRTVKIAERRWKLA